MDQQVLKTTISTIAESLGISRISDAVFTELANETQRRLFSVLDRSLQIMSTTKRTQLRTADINLALESLHSQPIFGYKNKEIRLINAGSVNAVDILFYEDNQIRFDQKGTRVELAPFPQEVRFEFEWMAVAGRSRAEPEEDESEDESPIVNPDSYMHNNTSTGLHHPDGQVDLASSRHVCSHELHGGYNRIRKELFSDDISTRESMLKFLSNSSIIQTLIPYFLTQSTIITTHEARIYKRLYTAVSISYAFTGNSSLRFIDSYLREMITISLTLLMSSGVLPRNIWEQVTIQDHAATLLQRLVDRTYKRMYANVQPRITSQLTSVLCMKRIGPIEKIGALKGLTELGIETITYHVLPCVDELAKETTKIMQESDPERHSQAVQLHHQQLKAAGLCIHEDTYQCGLGFLPALVNTAATYSKLSEHFGADLQPYVIDDSSFLYL